METQLKHMTSRVQALVQLQNRVGVTVRVRLWGWGTCCLCSHIDPLLKALSFFLAYLVLLTQ